MNLKLEPLLSNEIHLSNESMKITPEKEATFYLLDKGFTENEIEYIKDCNDKEGITFCKRIFINEDLEEVKIDLREMMKKEKLNRMISAVKRMFDLKTKNMFTY